MYLGDAVSGYMMQDWKRIENGLYEDKNIDSGNYIES